jgi:hypothetical protein
MKRMSPRPMSPKMLSWNKKLAMWRKNHRRADGSLPSLKSAMKACKGRRVSTKKCRRRKSFRKHRKAPGQYSPKRASPKKMSPLRKMSAQMKAKLSAKKQQKPAAQKKQQSPAVRKKQQKLAELQETFASEKAKMGDLDQKLKIARQRLAAVDERLRKAQRKPQFGQKAQAKPWSSMRFS